MQQKPASSDTVHVQPAWLREMIARDLETVREEEKAKPAEDAKTDATDATPAVSTSPAE